MYFWPHLTAEGTHGKGGDGLLPALLELVVEEAGTGRRTAAAVAFLCVAVSFSDGHAVWG